MRKYWDAVWSYHGIDGVLFAYNVGILVGATIVRNWWLALVTTTNIGLLLVFRAFRAVYLVKLDTARVRRAMAAKMFEEFGKAVTDGRVAFGGSLDVPDADEGTKH